MFILILGILFSILLAYSIYAGFKYTRMIGDIFMRLVYHPEIKLAPAIYQPQEVRILDSSGQEINALLLEKPNTSKLILFCHESGQSKSSWERYAFFLSEAGFSVLSLDLEDAESSLKKRNLSQWPTTAAVQRVETAIRWAKGALPTHHQIYLFGVSYGANVALSAGANCPAVRAIVTDGLFSMKEIIRDYIRRWAPILVKPNLFGQNYPFWVVNLFAHLGYWYIQRRERVRFIDVESILKRPHPPLLMIHGETDDYILSTHRDRLDKLCRGQVDAWRVLGGGHNEAVLVETKNYSDKILKFLESCERS